MSMKFTRRTLVACVAALICAALVPIAIRASSPEVLEACVNPGNGNIRLVSSGTPCHNNEKRVKWNVEGPAGPTGPPGPTGPAGPAGPPGSSSGGAPYTFICAPAHLTQSGSNTAADLYVHNASASTANVSVNILDRDGTNLLGHPIPGTSAPVQNYPGEANGATVPLAAAHTRNVRWVTPVVAGPGFDGITNVAVTVRVISDKPIVVASNFQFNPIAMPNVCYQVPK